MRRILRLLVWLFYLLAVAAWELLAQGPSPSGDAARRAVAGIVPKIMKADYEDDRPGLSRLYEELSPYLDDKAIGSRVRYWRGFALWRRFLNGINDKAPREEQEKDMKGCAAEFDEAIAKDSSFVDAKLGKASCLFSLSRSDTADTESRDKAMKLFVEIREEAKTTENPRVLLLVAASTWFIPAERGGGQAKAIEMYEQGLKIARRKSKEKADPLDPSWGEPELLSNLAWVNLHREKPDLDAAESYIRAALAIVPTWHYARDILQPQIRDARTKPPTTPTPTPPPG